MSDQKHKEGKMMKPRTKKEAVQIDQLPWKLFPDAFSQGGIRPAAISARRNYIERSN
jgi:hypothetical protein